MAANETQIRIAAVDATKQAFQSVNKNLNTLSGTIKRVAAPLAALFAGIGAASVIKETAAYAKEVERLSQVSGVGVERFQELAFAADRVGVSQEKLGDIFKDVSDKVGDFIQTGGGGMADFFENIAPQVGVTADQFRKLNGADALQLYVSSLQKANVSQNDMTFYLEAIASDASYLLPLLRNNGEAMGILGEEARSLGAVLNAEAIVEAKNLSDNMDRMNAVFKSIGRTLGNIVIPFLNSAAENFLALNRVIADRGGILETMGDFFNVMDDLKLKKVNEELEKVNRFLEMTPFARKAQLLSFMSDEQLLAEKARLEEARASFEKMVSPSKQLAIDFGANLEALRKRHKELSESMRKGPTENGPMTGSMTELNKVIAIQKAKAAELRKIYEQTRSPVDKLSDALWRAQDAYDNLGISTDQYLTLVEQANEAYDSTVIKTDRATDALRQYAEAAQDVKRSLQDAAMNGVKRLEDSLTSVLMGTMSVKDAFRNMALSIVEDLIRIQIQKSITGPIADALSGMFRAQGGSVQVGKPYIVGEKGPELFVPSSSGGIVPNNKLGGGDAGGTVIINQTLNFALGVQQTVRAEVMNLMPQISNAAKSAVADARLRGGSFAGAFR
jgi:methyl-accepting chemotaxis protein